MSSYPRGATLTRLSASGRERRRRIDPFVSCPGAPPAPTLAMASPVPKPCGDYGAPLQRWGPARARCHCARDSIVEGVGLSRAAFSSSWTRSRPESERRHTDPAPVSPHAWVTLGKARITEEMTQSCAIGRGEEWADFPGRPVEGRSVWRAAALPALPDRVAGPYWGRATGLGGRLGEQHPTRPEKNLGRLPRPGVRDGDREGPGCCTRPARDGTALDRPSQEPTHSSPRPITSWVISSVIRGLRRSGPCATGAGSCVALVRSRAWDQIPARGKELRETHPCNNRVSRAVGRVEPRSSPAAGVRRSRRMASAPDSPWPG